MQYYKGLPIGFEIQIGQLLFNHASCCFLNDVIYATGHISSLRCCFGAPMPLSHRAIGLWDFVTTKMQYRIVSLSRAACSDCCRKSETLSIYRAAFDLRPGRFREKFAVGFYPLSKNWSHCCIKLCHIYVTSNVTVFGTSIETVLDMCKNSYLALCHKNYRNTIVRFTFWICWLWLVVNSLADDLFE